MNDLRLKEIKERVVKATPGPWIVEASRYEGKYNAASIDENYDLPACLMNSEDAKFIVHARQDVPDLLAEVERLQTDLMQWKKDCGQLYNDSLADKAEIARLRKALYKATPPSVDELIVEGKRIGEVTE